MTLTLYPASLGKSLNPDPNLKREKLIIMHHSQTELGTSAAPRSVEDGAKVITWA